MTEKLDVIVFDTGCFPTAGIVWLHGLGADGHDFEPLARQLNLPFAVRYVFPHAPIRPVTINGGMRMRAWYDIVSSNLLDRVDKAGIRHSQALVAALLDEQIASGLQPKRLILGGFSQGGVMALETGLRRDPPLGGIVVLSGYVALGSELPEAKLDAPPILMMHGNQDPLVPLPIAEQGQALLVSKGYTIDWRVFRMAHAVCAEELEVLHQWLIRRLS